MNASSACALAVAYFPRTKHCTVLCCRMWTGGIELSGVWFLIWRMLTMTLRMENRRAAQSGDAVDGDFQKSSYLNC